MTTVEQDVTVRPASAADRTSVLGLLEASLGWESDDRHADFFSWKHEQNPFGPSPAWVAVDGDGRLLGFRAFLRWEFTQGSAVVRAARAVDTATRPDVQRRGIFSRLTTTAIEGLVRNEVAFVFNTPNRQSLPGYLKMGWQRIGRLPVRARSPSVRRWTRLLGARRPADKWSLMTGAGTPAGDAFADTGLCRATRCGTRSHRGSTHSGRCRVPTVALRVPRAPVPRRDRRPHRRGRDRRVSASAGGAQRSRR